MVSKTIAIIAGESSGDLIGGLLVRAVKEKDPMVSFFGVGGERMRGAGVELLHTTQEMAFLGFVEVLEHLPFISRVLNEMESLLRKRKPGLLVLIDYPEFNLRLAERAKRLGIPVMYYISPQVWAWGKGRVRKIKRVVDRMVVAFPFEVEIYKKEGVPVEFVGHPLFEVVKSRMTRQEFCTQAGLSPDKPILGLLPGSRRQEVEKILPVMVEAARMIKEKKPDVQPVVGKAEGLEDTDFALTADVPKVKGLTYGLMAASDLVLVASGSATLETGILGTPMVVLYKTSWLSYLIAKMVVTIPNIALINVIAGKRLVPEFVQGQARPDKVAKAALELLEDSTKREEIKQELKKAVSSLGGPGASAKAAGIVLSMLGEISHSG
jgi:lipid-A-disaccharide synthase